MADLIDLTSTDDEALPSPQPLPSAEAIDLTRDDSDDSHMALPANQSLLQQSAQRRRQTSLQAPKEASAAPLSDLIQEKQNLQQSTGGSTRDAAKMQVLRPHQSCVNKAEQQWQSAGETVKPLAGAGICCVTSAEFKPVVVYNSAISIAVCYITGQYTYIHLRLVNTAQQ